MAPTARLWSMACKPQPGQSYDKKTDTVTPDMKACSSVAKVADDKAAAYYKDHPEVTAVTKKISGEEIAEHDRGRLKPQPD